MKTLLLMLCLTLTACSTMTFVNGPKMEETVVREHWHHLIISGLFEVSNPVDLDYNCANQQWDSVTVEKTFINSVASVTWLYVSLYSPWAVLYECRESIDT